MKRSFNNQLSFEDQINGVHVYSDSITVPSASNRGQDYKIRRDRAGRLTCTCDGFHYHAHIASFQCRHILAALLYVGHTVISIEGNDRSALRLVISEAMDNPLRLMDGYLYADYRSPDSPVGFCRYSSKPRGYNPQAVLKMRKTTERLTQLELEALPIALKAMWIEVTGGDVLAELRTRSNRCSIFWAA